MKLFNSITTGIIASSSLLTAFPQRLLAEPTPFDVIVASVSISVCLREFGADESTRMLFIDGMREAYGDKVVKNVMNNSAFEERMQNHIKDMGGCSALISSTQAKVREELGDASKNY